MGLIKAISGAIRGVAADQWKEYFYCDSMDANVLVTKGIKRASGKFGSGNKGNDNLITNGSVVAVNEGQCMIIVDQGKVVEICAEAGDFLYDTSTEPSLLFGDLGDNIGKTFAAIGRRFTFAGDTGKDQRVYFFNTKEILGNKYGTANPVPFRVVDANIGLDVDISVRCNGEYSYRIVDPILFYTNVCGNVTEEYTRDKIDSQLKSELMTALQPAFAQISAMGIRYSAVPAHTMEVADALNEVLTEKWQQLRGIRIVSFGVNTIKASEEDEAMIKELQKTAVLRNPNMAAATLVGAQAEAMKSAASNTATGPMMAFAGMNMANNAGGFQAGELFQMGAQRNSQPGNSQVQQGNPSGQESQRAKEGEKAGGNTWTCQCGKVNTGKFCVECGSKKPVEEGWTCSCGTVNKGKFCMECGKKKPEGAPLYKCDKCGWEPEDPYHPPKFCPECGDIFDENDVTPAR
ncbi:SPFH domain-containing protein [Roseburia sp. 1XD42-69]|uniref:SPFH domain-containing protein n=1 Tax=Roseburia sp. 1XD42-69 TaxID=2320088 RepID=UPI000EA33296|nr:SPFH domain-containing protein [Roseburia sp. 1XD42-69]RKJ64662.1 SPFH domain-containing protein [Roseburia sp. 1XD42-69]